MTRAEVPQADVWWPLDAAEAGDPPRRGMPAWLASLALHTALVLAAGLLGSNPPRSALVAERTVGIALVQRSESRVNYFSEARTTPAPSPATTTEKTASEPYPSLDQVPRELAASLPSLQELGALMGSGPALPNAAGLTRGGRPTRNVGGSGTSTQVFGAQATGSKFVYVFDRSASMDGFRGRPMRAAKAELVASLQDLAQVHQFQIIFYNEQISVFNPSRPLPPRMMFATEENKKLADNYIRSIDPAGGTRHADPLQMALGLQPDAVFLLTDAEEPRLTPSELAEIRRRNRAGTSIHTIEFGSGPFRGGENFLVLLAHQNHGQHVYVDLSRLPE